MVHAKYYTAVSTFVKVLQRKLWPLFPDTVHKQPKQVAVVLVMANSSLFKKSNRKGMKFGKIDRQAIEANTHRVTSQTLDLTL